MIKTVFKLLISLFLLSLIILYLVQGVGIVEDTGWEVNLTSVRFSAVAFGDVDNDNRSDLVVIGCLGGAGGQDCDNGAIAKIYTNNGTSLNENISWGFNLTGIGHGSVALGDINNDGKLDLVLTGCTSATSAAGCNGNIIAKVYINNISSLNENISWQQNLTGLWSGNLALVDINNDGRLDLAIIGKTSTTKLTKIYINNGSSLVENINWANNLTGLDDGSLSFADIDNDGKIDMGITGEDSNGNKKTIIYINNGTAFLSSFIWGQVLKQASQSGMIFGDYDNDADMDMVLMGCCDYLYTYTNNGSSFTESQKNVGEGGDLGGGLFAGSLAFGDYNNDGYIDFVGIGRESGRSAIYNNSNGNFVKDTIAGNSITNDDFYHGAISWNDLDNDGDLDLIIEGYSVNALSVSRKVYVSNASLYSNNSLPTSPSTFQNNSLANGDVFLGWNNGNDNETTSLGLYYNLRVGTTSGGNDIVSGVFGGSSGGEWRGGGPANGYFGNMMQRRNISLSGSRFSVGTTYYWSVQTIDTGLAKSAWSTEQTFTLTSDFTPPVVTLNAPSGVTNQTLNIVFNASVYDDYNLTNVSLYGNWSGWHLNVTNSSGINNTDYIFKANLTEGEWLWGIRACDEQSNCRGVNGTFRIDITYPIVALVSPANGTSQTSSNSVTFTYNVSDVAINNCTLYLNGVANESDTSITSNGSAQTFSENVPNGNYNWTIRCADAANNINTSGNFSLTISYTPSETPASTSGGGGGGGGAVSVAITRVTRIIAVIAEGNNLIEFAESEKASVGIEEIMLDSATASSNVKITIEKLTAMPASIASSPSGDVYTYLQFNKTVLKDEDVKQAKIIFTVSKDWVARNGYDYNKIVLQRYTTQWNALPTAYLKQNASNYYYQASTPGFSVFAITAEKKQEAQPITAEKANKTEEKPVIPAEEAPKAPEKAMKSLIKPAYLVLIAIAIIVTFIVVVLKKSKRK